MTTQIHNLFIIGGNQVITQNLDDYLKETFGTTLNISIFNNGENALKNIDSNTNIVIIDDFLPDLSGNDLLKSIKKINPKTEVIMLSSKEEIKLAIDAFRNGATDYIIIGSGAKNRIANDIKRIVFYPIRVLAQEFGISTFLAVFLLSFITVGILVLIGYFFINN